MSDKICRLKMNDDNINYIVTKYMPIYYRWKINNIIKM